MSVDRCICTNQTFKYLLDQAKSLGIEHDLDALEQATGMGGSCGICRPYLRVVLATGRTVLPVLSPEELERMAEHIEPEQPEQKRPPQEHSEDRHEN